MDINRESSKQEDLIEGFIYIFFVGLLAFLLTYKLFPLFFELNEFHGFLYIFSLPVIFVLSALSFKFHKYFKIQRKITWRAFVIIGNSILVSIFGISITYIFITS